MDLWKKEFLALLNEESQGWQLIPCWRRKESPYVKGGVLYQTGRSLIRDSHSQCPLVHIANRLLGGNFQNVDYVTAGSHLAFLPSQITTIVRTSDDVWECSFFDRDLRDMMIAILGIKLSRYQSVRWRTT